MTKNLKVNSEGQKEIEKLSKEFDQFEETLNTMTLDRNETNAPKLEQEPQTNLSSSEINNSKDIYLKPSRSIGSREKFNEKFRDKYNFLKEYVKFIAENIEIKGEKIELWTKPFPGMPAEFWEVPVNKPVWGPRYLAEQITKANYHRFRIDNQISQDTTVGSFKGGIITDVLVQRLDARPVTPRNSIFMGATQFK